MKRADAFVALASVLIAGGCIALAAVAAPSSHSPAPRAVTSSALTAASADLVGPGCAAYESQVRRGAGSIVGMSQDPVTVAASNNPLLKTLVAAVSGRLNPKVNLVSTLDGGQFTIFAPVDSAFAKLPKSTIADLAKPANARALTSLLTYHVLAGQFLPADIAGTHKTVEGGTVTVTGSDDSMTVNKATVICGGVHTANATVYLIDTVLTPPSR